MPKVTCDLSISVDGYSAGHNQTEQRSFGDDGSDGWGNRLHAWMFDAPDENRVEIERMASAKAFIIGRNMFGPVRGPWDRAWNGWWGDNPPFHTPVFVLTHYLRNPQPARNLTLLEVGRGASHLASQVLNWNWFCPDHRERPGFPRVGHRNVAIRFDPKRGLGRNRTLTKSGCTNQKEGAAQCAAPSFLLFAYNQAVIRKSLLK